MTFQENPINSSLWEPCTVVMEGMVRRAGDWVLGIEIDICPPSTGMAATGHAKP